MSDDEPYDADGDVGRFLQCHSPEAHRYLFPLSTTPAIHNAEHDEAVYGAEHYEAAAPISNDDAGQLPGGMDVDHHEYQEIEEGVHGEHYNHEMTISSSGHHHQITDAGHYHAAIEHRHQVPRDAVVELGQQYEAMAMDVHMMAAQETQLQGRNGLPDPTPPMLQGDGVRFESDPAPDVDVEPPQYEAVAMDVVVPPAADVTQANGALPDPTPPMPWSLEFPDPPSPTMCRMLDELAAMIQGGIDDEGGGGDNNNGAAGGAEAGEEEGSEDDAAAAIGAEADARDVNNDDDAAPADEEVKFKLIAHGQLDCGRCRSVREVLAIDWPSKIHFAVHSTYPETFEHAVTHRMLMGADGHFHTHALLYLDLRGRRIQWVQNFIAKSVDTMKTRNAGTVLDTNDPSTSNNAAVVNNFTAPQPAMHLEVGMLHNLLTATATNDQAPNPQAAQPVQEQGNTDAPPVAEAQVPEAAVQPAAVTQAQETTTDTLSVAEAAAPAEAAVSAVTQAHQQNPAAPSGADEAALVPQVAQPANSHALERFPPFNWDGFKPDILESSEVEPYDPASGVNVLMYPSMLEQLQLEKLKKNESKKLSKLTVEETPEYLNINDDHYANAPNFASAAFKLVCERDPTYRMFKRRVSGLNRKIKKLEQGAKRVGTGGLFKIKQKLETFKQEKEELYDVIKRGMQEMENERRHDDGAGPSNRAGPSYNPRSSSGAGPSNVAGTTTSTSDDAGPSNVAAGTSNKDDAGPSSSTVDPSNIAGPSGTK